MEERETNVGCAVPAISVIVPVYNVEKYLHRCVDSILAQSFTDFELILVDDGSEDGSGTICDEYASGDVRVRVFHQENAGVSSARNRGIQEACGHYVTFIDSDDFVEANFFEVAICTAEAYGVDVYISGIRMETYCDEELVDAIVYTASNEKEYTVKGLLEDLQVNYPQICICGPWCKLYLAEIIKKNNTMFPKDLSLGEDTYFNLEILEKVDKIFFSKDVFYHYYRGNPASLFSKFVPDTYNIHIRVYDKMRDLMVRWLCSDEAMLRFENMYFTMLLGGLHSYYRFGDLTTETQKLQQIKKIAHNSHIRKNKVRDIKGFKAKTQLILLKIKAYTLINTIFKWYYLRKTNDE